MTVVAPVRDPKNSGDTVAFTGGSSTADNEILLELDARGLTEFHASSAAGSFDIMVSHDGTNYLAAQVAMEDLTSTTPATRVIATTATKAAMFKGFYNRIRFMQAGATAVTGFCVIAK